MLKCESEKAQDSEVGVQEDHTAIRLGFGGDPG